ncbi:MAG: hypothetical protein H6702_22125 [Myxococcales bacterium]|nr:hypothetical protein [Myxococcales bacterium]
MTRGRRAPLALLALLAPGLAWAGPWTRGPGQAYVKVSESLYTADAFQDASGRVVGGVDYTGWTSALYAEVGVARGLHLQAFLPHSVATNDFGGAAFRSARLGDARLAAQWSLPWLDFPQAVRAEVKLPLYDAAEPGGLQGASFPLIGDGQVDGRLWISAGGSLPGTPLYGFVELGYEHRTEWAVGDGLDRRFADGALAFAQVGATVWRGVVLAANAQAVVPLAEDASTKGYATVGPGLFAPVGGGLALEASADFTPWARNSARGTQVSLGVSWSR